ncbi:MAG TPA: CinA family protein [Jatrophihabitantaceae bacterium]
MSSAAEPAARVHERLLELGATVAVAESLTGGLLTAELTAIPGASATVRGGLVVYATDLKSSLAGVEEHLLAARGPVDPDVAAALANGVRHRLAATYGVAVTGVAGPDRQGGQAVGTVFAAVSGPAGVTGAAWALPGGREQIRAAAVAGCVALLLAELDRAAGALTH